MLHSNPTTTLVINYNNQDQQQLLGSGTVSTAGTVSKSKI